MSSPSPEIISVVVIIISFMTDLVFPKTQPVDKQVYVTIHNIQSMEMEKERIPSLFDKIKFNFIQDTFIEMFKTVLCCFYVS